MRLLPLERVGFTMTCHGFARGEMDDVIAYLVT